MDYRETLNLPKTDFPMRANLPKREPEILARWEAENTYGQMTQRTADRPAFVLHDGPPYANGNIHPGTVLNKVLKDIVVKHRNMTGWHTEYIPGWDCHGLPIEHNVLKEEGIDRDALPIEEIRQRCREYALRFVDIQRSEFKRLGVLGRWEEPYLTLHQSYEASIVREFGNFVRSGAVYRGKKPIYWCAECRTALAEAEIEYHDHESPSIYVKFAVQDDLRERLPELGDRPAFVVIWTTTPWTIPSNLAIALHPEFEYSMLLAPNGEVYIVASYLAPVFTEELGLEGVEELGRFEGSKLENTNTSHPFIDRPSRIILGDHVTLEAGTGCVHTAPGHGAEDFEVGRRYGLEVYAPVDDLGRFTQDVEHFAGRMVFETNDDVCALLESRGALLKRAQIAHSYPHCWRCKNPIIFRATAQWFVSMDATGLRKNTLAETERVSWIPRWGRDRFRGMVENRPDWCISRQRSWGVPIPAFYCGDCGHELLDADVIDHVAGVFEQRGSDAWFTSPVEELVPSNVTCSSCGGAEFRAERDIVDVWFESGVSWAAVMEPILGRDRKVELYLEGSDQHRGWFQSAMLTGMVTRGHAPFEAVLTHGFVVDGDGHKMSKSLGNYIPPAKTIEQYGAEILRLWVASEDYREDIRLSGEILKRLADAYRKLRNTTRFLLSNLYDFDPNTDCVAPETLLPIDRWMMHRLHEVLGRVRAAYDNYEFHVIHHTLVEFAAVDLSAFYLDILKDRLYASAATDPGRRAGQTVMYEVLRAFLAMLAPVLSFTAEEAWAHAPRRQGDPESIFLLDIPAPDETWRDTALAEEWRALREVRSVVSRELELARNEKVIGHSLEASVALTVGADTDARKVLEAHADELDRIFIVSGASLAIAAEGADLPEGGVAVSVQAAPGGKCSRCWIRTEALGTHPDHPELCPRCTSVVAS